MKLKFYTLIIALFVTTGSVWAQTSVLLKTTAPEISLSVGFENSFTMWANDTQLFNGFDATVVPDENGEIRIGGGTITELYCGYSQITSIEFYFCSNLGALYCEGNDLTELDLSVLPNLQILSCSNNQLTYLNTSGTRLTYLYAGNQSITVHGNNGDYINPIQYIRKDGSIEDVEIDRARYAKDASLPIPTDGRILNFSTNYGYSSAIGTNAFAGTITLSDIVATPSRPVGNKGVVDLSLDIPSDKSLTGEFTVTMPEGFSLDKNNTVLASELQNNHSLEISDKATGVWTMKISTENGTRSASDVTYRKIVEIAYTIDDNVATGNYKIQISDLDFKMSDNTTIKENDIDVSIPYSTVGNELMNRDVMVRCHNNTLSVSSPQNEIVGIYSITGALLFSTQKSEGEMKYNISNVPNGILIVKGSSGWVEKVIKK